MGLQLLLALAAGIVTVVNPCVWPLVPVILATSVDSRIPRTRAFWIILGFATVFTVLGFFFASVQLWLPISPSVMRWIAVVILVVMGVLTFTSSFTAKLFGPVQRLATKSSQARNGISGMLIGMSLAFVWTPCVGPFLGSLFGLAASGTSPVGSAFLFFVYAIGVMIPMVVVFLGSTFILGKLQWASRHGVLLQKIYGAILIAFALVIALGWDRTFIRWITPLVPNVPL